MNKIVKSIVAFLTSVVTIGAAACTPSGGESSQGGNSSTYTEQSGSQVSDGTDSGTQDSGQGGSDSTGEDSGDEGGETPETPQGPIFPEPETEEPDPTPMGVGAEMLISYLKNTQYRSAVANSSLGLTAANEIGADERAFSRVLYPAPIGGVETYNAADYGVTPDGTNNTRDLNALIRTLKDVTGVKMIVLDKGTYTFSTTIEVDEVDDLYIVGNETEFVYSTWCTAIHVKDAENVHLNGISIDYDPSAVVSGTVKSCNTDAKTITIQLYDEFSLTPSRYNNGKIKYGSYMEFREDGKGNLYPDANANLLYNSTGDRVENITDGSYNASKNELTLTFKNMKSVGAGTKVSVAFTMYEYPCVMVDDSENFYMEGCNLYSAAGMGIKLDSVKNAYLNRTNIMLKPGSQRLMTVTADGLHAKDCYGDLQLTGSIFENSHDDCINIASFYKNVTGVSRKDKTITCEASSTATNYPFQEGDVLEVYDPTSFELCATYKVVAVESSALTTIVTVDKKVTDELVGKIIGNVTRSAKVKINNCIFRNKRNRGILLQTRDSDISGNTFQNIIHGPISLHSVLDIFSEALMPSNVTITNNKFINNNEGYGLGGDVAVFAWGLSGQGGVNVIQNITVKNNFFYNSARPGVYFTAGGNSKIENNLLCLTGRVSGDKHAIYVGNSENVTVGGNCMVRRETGDYAVVRFDNATVTDTENKIEILGDI